MLAMLPLLCIFDINDGHCMFKVKKPANEQVFLWQRGQRMSEPERDAKLNVPADRKVPIKQGHNLNLRKLRLSAPYQ